MSFGPGHIVSCTSEGGRAKMVFDANGQEITVTPEDECIVISSDKDFSITFTHKEHQVYMESADEKGINYRHLGFAYRMSLTDGMISDITAGGCMLHSEGGRLVMTFDKR
ncbi:MAG: hypothetical protein MJ175_13110 [Clostridia bacterium]|nr:hypothetical protein [Clostridia bacterium]